MALLGTLTSGVSALKTFGKSLEVIGNNISNVNTTAYKGQSSNFADSFSNTLRAASATDSAMQVGTGVQLGGINTNYKQGSLTSTGNGTDLAISGNGYFVVQDGSGATFATRDGSFHFDTNGNLLNSQNLQVVGVGGTPIQVTGYASLASVSIGTDGNITAFAPDGTSTNAGQIGLLAISDQSKLMKVGSNMYDFGATGVVVGDIAAPAAAGLGKIQAGQLELSNVDLTEQFSDLISSQRSFQAASRLITVSDSVLEDIVNLKR